MSKRLPKGSAGGKARAQKLSEKRRKEIAASGGKSTWAKIRAGALQVKPQ